MALKPSRYVEIEDYYYYDGPETERGVILTVNKKQNYLDHICVSCNQSPTLEPVGLLLNDVVKLNINKPFNVCMSEVRPGGRISIVKKGWVITNKVCGSPKTGQDAILYPNGCVGAWLWGGKPCKKTKVVGRFGSCKDKDGFIKLYLNI